MAAPLTPALLEISHLSRRFGERRALEDVSFSVEAGEVFGLLGPNGAGKSTLFRILAGLLRADGGTLFFQGRPSALESADFRARLGVVFQSGSLDGQLTAWENLMLGARLYGLRWSEAARRAEEMLALFGLQPRGAERVATWSGGMRRRLELARALIHHPSILLMDEPTQGLDEASFRAFWQYLDAARGQGGLTVILTSHRADEAERCDRLGLLDGGRWVGCDTPQAWAGRWGGDVLTLETEAVAEVTEALRGRFALEAEPFGRGLRLEHPKGHELIPRLVEALPAGTLTSVSLRRPTLGDVFLRLTGNALEGEAP
ncbi:MAG TPA: ABC transporter ATP-binding protein [Myxococcaceae bacterium]|nr:ABC transporter ATP-binding protein [Myxococcaceae bacterium]